jgi:hypothetical protein
MESGFYMMKCCQFDDSFDMSTTASVGNSNANDAKSMERYELWVIEKVKQGRAVIGLYPMNDETRAEFEEYTAEQDKK